ncbi:putative glucuronoxylan glucuronosyltransferase F8H [Platanthera zijinensis]|uniref:Glucuronoxylan glucuronosyltransferase F8H n=1 Tax=Platanthera zijinensis TaxID=2320716 RepID=A0AAP0BAZ3_9ASPA
MKQLLSRRSSPDKPQQCHQFLKKYYRCLLWISLSIYLFLSTSPPSFHHSPLSRRTLSQTLASPSSLPLSLKIYVYDLPPEFNAAWLSNPRCASHLFAAEVAIHDALLHSSVRAVNHLDADYFFVPVYVSCDFSTINGFPSLRHARPLLSSAVDLISTNFPFWNRSNGFDHVFVASHDYGACFHAMEDVAIAEGIPTFMKNSILLQTFGMMSPHACQEAEHVVIPPYISPEDDRRPPPETARRDIFAFFRGKMEIHPKNISGRFYSRKVRTEIWNKYSGNRRFYLRRHRYDGYQSEIARSVFCLCPLGWAPWSPRLVESVALGCVPVIIADGIRLPFPEAVPWPEISLSVAERDVAGLEHLLDRVAATNLSAIQRRLWDPAVRRALLFHRPGVIEGDASWNILRTLESKVHRRSWRRRSGQPLPDSSVRWA